MLESYDLNGTWQFAEVALTRNQFDTITVPELNAMIESDGFLKKIRRKTFMTASVPGDNVQDLLANQRIDHPFTGMNATKLRWIEKRLWCYRRRFKPPRALAGRVDLVFEGLDTYATVILNGGTVGRTDNMFHPWRFDVTDKLNPGEDNELIVLFHPWQVHTRDKDISNVWAPFCKERVWMRKAQMETGWDWGPRISLSGIWRPVRLEAVDSVRIAAWHFKTLRCSPRNAEVEITVELDRVARGKVKIDVTIEAGRQKLSGTVTTGGKSAAVRLDVPKPKLWWPADLGEPNLYRVKIHAAVDGKPADEVHGRSGIRTVELLQEPQGKGCRSFTFLVNNRKVYMAGANWIPGHCFISSVTSADYRQRLRSAVDANMNTIRVWGGGVYEDDAFYDLCDEMGLMVWQDFMFACGNYPGHDGEFVASVEKEFDLVIRRLRTHPSIVVWNGNNENQWIDDQVNWGKPGHEMTDRHIYHAILPKATKRLDGTRPYWPSSPYGGNDHNDWRKGVQHAYKVWVGLRIPREFGQPPDYPDDADRAEIRHYRHYADVVPRFVGEFSAQGLPYAGTLRTYLSRDQLDPKHRALRFRYKAGKTFETLRSFQKYITGWGRTYDELELKTQFGQARAMEFGISHHRRHLWQCSGSLVWQLNDCWPGLSWSLSDFHMLPKPAWFAVKRAFAPRLLTLVEDRATFELYGVNTSGRKWAGRVALTVQTFTGRVLGQTTVRFSVPDSAAQCIAPDVLAACGLDDIDRTTTFIRAHVVSGRETAPAWYVDDPVRLDLPPAEIKPRLNVVQTDRSFSHELTIESLDHFALFVGLIPPDADCRFEDNFFNIEPKGRARIVFAAPRKYSLSKLKLRGYNC